MKIGITYDLRQEYLDIGFGEEDTVEFDRIDTVEAIESTLRDLGHQTDRIGNVRRLVERLSRGHRWDLVFNIAEGLYGFGREAQVPAVLDAYAIPYTFSDPMVCAIALHKGTCNRLVRDLGIPTADFAVVSRIEDVDGVDLPFPLFAKPVAEGTSKGVTGGSKICTREDLRETCRLLLEKFNQPVLVETFLSGREFTVGVVGTGDEAVAIGAMEVLLNNKAEQEVYSYHNKAHYEDLVEYRLGDPADPAVARTLDLALDAWKGLGCRDAGRVDVRADGAGNPRFLEVNPLAGLNPDISDLPILAKLSGVSYRDLIERIMASATRRIPARPALLPAGLATARSAVPKAPKPPRVPASRTAPRVVMLHEKIDSGAPADLSDLASEMDFLTGILTRLGYDVMPLAMTLDMRSVAHALRRLRPAVVFNLAETVDRQGRLAHLAPSLLDRLGVPYTGSGPEAMLQTSSKVMAKRALAAAGVPTPAWVTLDEVSAGEIHFDPPYIVKSVWEEASIGLDEDSVVPDRGRLLHEMELRLPLLGGSAFAEQFVEGREFNVGVLGGPGGPEVLPIAEMTFDYPDGKLRVMGYRAKWDENSYEYSHTVRSYELRPDDGPLLERLRAVAIRCWHLFGCSGYARVDFRVANDGTPYVLEVNANPCLSAHAGFMASAGRAGMSPEQVVQRILADARRPHRSGELFLSGGKGAKGTRAAGGNGKGTKTNATSSGNGDAQRNGRGGARGPVSP
jgi:D-alanine-D-alanine ligase